MAASEAVMERFGTEEAALTKWRVNYEAGENVKVARHMANAFRAGYRAAMRDVASAPGEDQQAKLEALAVAQDRLREAERAVEIIRQFEKHLENGELARASLDGLFRHSFDEEEVKVITTGLLLARRSAMGDVEQAKARLEGMLK